ncbi:5-oxoprolinase subunit PxpA [Phreatobacter sp.]|uniref:LamB/YcsF family protein n=1 Tax=Phreatobacter sp. TaxID=1966341 RepID=UPI0025F0DCC5|nr:5-oxoprolinase subunit PxpA [Phreatobacter sp.]
MTAVDLNSDMGEGFGPWKMGDDEAMLSIVSSANVACGWHAGDPVIMHRTAEIAKAKGVSIGAHPGFGDLWGFGRRVIRGDSMGDLEKQIAYQVGAMQALAVMAGHQVTHVKTHGALGNMSNDDDEMAMAVGRAIKAVDPTLVFVVMPGLSTERAAEKLGLPMAREVFADRTYDDSGNLTSRKVAGAVIHDAALAAARVLRMVEDQEVVTVTGKRIKVAIDTICVHGDNPAAVAMARTVRDRLEAAGITIRPFKAA